MKKKKPIHQKTDKQWEEENKKAIDYYNALVKKEGLILKQSRMF